MSENDDSVRRGVPYAFTAFAIWGLLPLYWKALSAVDAASILACRVVFSLAFIWIVLALRGNPAWPRIFADAKARITLLLSAALIGINWGLYIWAVNSGRTVEASLGYYINPLVNVFFGTIFFRERLTRLRWFSFALASAGVVALSASTGSIPWISLVLAVSFSLYGLAKKAAGLDPLEALGAETLALAPLALAYLAFRGASGESVLNHSFPVLALLAFSGIVTALPLLAFAVGAKLLPLSVLGFIQYISPTLQLALGVLAFGEPFPAERLFAFVLVWAALIIYSASYLPRSRRPRLPATPGAGRRRRP